ncbi:Uncharacterized protein APZ42_032496 [Daphnia magna]|uniref:Uncharacterized protein n=1 Tax=Daphnia magna TaxID=35525 RepID=A0A164LKM5_9CRUS|nr:Uncharacterized protein APZ42_032496 [Daphnia magna]
MPRFHLSKFVSRLPPMMDEHSATVPYPPLYILRIASTESEMWLQGVTVGRVPHHNLLQLFI